MRCLDEIKADQYDYAANDRIYPFIYFIALFYYYYYYCGYYWILDKLENIVIKQIMLKI